MRARRDSVDAAGRRLADHRPRPLRHRSTGSTTSAPCSRWSIADLDDFWRASTEFTGVRWATPADGDPRRRRRCPVCAGSPAPRSTTPSRRWRRGLTDPQGIAVVAVSQTRDPIELTWDRARRSACAAAPPALRRLGVGTGDRVVAYAPNIPETLVAFLATASLGARVVELRAGVRRALGDRPLRPDRARRAGRRRRLPLRQHGHRPPRSGRRHRRRAADAAPRRPRAVPPPPPRPERSTARRAPRVGRASCSAPRRNRRRSRRSPADHPLYVLFSSGTTGLPKAIVHGHGGIVAEHLKVLTFHQDLRPWRSLLLVHHDRLDDVELPRVRPARRLDDRAVRRRPRRTRR